MSPALPGLRPEARAFLDPAAGPLAPPVRAALFGHDGFGLHGVALARAQPIERRRGRRALRMPPFFPRLARNLALLKRVQAYLEAVERDGESLSPAAEWLMDHFHAIEAQVPEIRTGMPSHYYAELPKLRSQALAGLPRIYGIAWAFVAHTDSSFDPELLRHFLLAYQEVDVLRLGELWALPATLRVVLLENLARLAERVAAHKAARELAAWCWERGAELDETRLNALYAPLERRGVHTAFLAELSQRLYGLQPAEGPAWRAWLEARAPDAAAQLAQAQALRAANDVSVRHALQALRAIDILDWAALVESVSPVLQQLKRSPAFSACSPLTRDQCTHAVERLARHSRWAAPGAAAAAHGMQRGPLSELEIAEAALRLSQVDGATQVLGPPYFLIGPGRAQLAQACDVQPPLPAPNLRRRWVVYAATLVLGTLALMQAAIAGEALVPWAELLTVLLLAFPASQCVLALLHRLSAELVPGQRLPRLALAEGLRPEHRTLVVMPCLLRDTGGIGTLAQALERAWLANREAHSQFALLSDWVDAPQRQAAGDRLLLDAAHAAICTLNARHPMPDGEPGPRFLLLHRERSWSQSEQAWIGWERKRGKLEQLVAWLVGAGPSPFIDLGRACLPQPGVAHVLTLDTDTCLPPGTLRELVAVAAHPLNAPQLDPHTRRVHAGYGVLQPRVAATPPRDSSAFAWLQCGPQAGLDSYGSASPELYQDLFGEGSFAGKGLLNVRAFHAALQGRIPDEQLLSHDLYEGLWARCACVPDIVLLEPQPLRPDADAARRHRWTRGDWQLLAFLGAALHGRVGAVNLWKLVDNLRRSLLAPASVGLLWVSFALETVMPARALALVFGAHALAALLDGVAALMPGRPDAARAHRLREALRQVARALLGGAWRLASLMSEALLQLQAIGSALWRMGVSRRRLLQWTPSAQAEAGAHHDLPALLRRHGPASAAGLAWGVLGLPVPDAHIGWLLGFGLLWAAAPGLVWAMGQPLRRWQRKTAPSPADRAYLHDLARDTWRLYELAVGPASHHLPPEHLQVEPRALLAQRSSPAHIGLYLLATACAQRLGFIGTSETIERLTLTLDTLARLPRHRGHVHQWIDTQTLDTLAPAQVSTTDSGTLAACLWAVAEACREMASMPAPHEAMGRALRAAFHRLRHHSEQALAELLREAPLQALLAEDPWALWRRDPLRLRGLLDAAQALWQHKRTQMGYDDPGLQPLADLLRQLDSLLRDREAERDRWGVALRALAERADSIAAAMDFGFLYDPARRLLHTGWRLAEATPEPGHFELLACEARLAGFVAIAKGDVPQAHWQALRRPFVGVHGKPALKSWAGSMLEYLMPALVMDEPAGGLLARSAQQAVRAQQDFGAAHGLPWGLSPSTYFARDSGLAEHHGVFGVPKLALRRTPQEDRVVAPYASALALLVDPAAALVNLKRLERLGARGLCGFIEALDFTRSRLGDDGQPRHVAAFMAHHQGMSLAALTHLLADAAPRRWFSHSPLAQAHAPLLQENLPREIVFQPDDPSLRPPTRQDDAAARPAVRSLDPAAQPLGGAPTQLLGNGAYTVALRPGGTGSSHWRGRAISRSRDDALRDGHGTWLLLRRPGELEYHSLTRAPHPRPDARYRTRFLHDRAEFDAECRDWESRLTVWVSPDDDIELRQLSLHNLSDTDTEFELLSWFEPALSSQRADEADTALGRLFVQAHAADPRGVLLERRPRGEDEAPLWAAHFLATCDIEPTSVRITCDRARLLPRLGQVAQARPGANAVPRADGLLDTGLDPVAALAVRVLVPAQARLTLSFATAAAAEADTLLAVVDKYREPVHLERSRQMAATLTRIRERELRLEAADLQAVQDLTTRLLAQTPQPRQAPLDETPGRSPAGPRPSGSLEGAQPPLDRRTLLRLGIPGERPILLLRLNTALGLPLVQTLLTAQRLWDGAGLPVDLVVLNGEPDGPTAPLQEAIAGLQQALGAATDRQPERGAVHLLRAASISAQEATALQAHARAQLLADGRPLARLLAPAPGEPSRTALIGARGTEPLLLPGRLTRAPLAETPAPDALAAGRFTDGGRGFEILMDSLRVTPRPWSNLLANPHFGCLVTEAGGGFTWARDSRLQQLTPASHDALLDPPSEHFLLQDLATRETWGLLPTLDRNGLQGYRVTHAQGESRFEHTRAGLSLQVRVAVHPQASAKVLQVRLRNTGAQARVLRLLGLVEWQLGARRADRMTLATEFVPELQAVLARQLEHRGGFGGATAFLMLTGVAARQWTCAREEFFDSLGRLHLPRALTGACGFGLDPCGALEAAVTLPPRATLACEWVIGWGEDREAALALARQLQAPGAACAVPDQALRFWDQRLQAVQVRTPDPLFDALVNCWLPYQAAACGLWSRTGFHQSAGALDFRGQLQDAMALALADPQALRAQLLLHAGRQFREGDVQHRWHPATGAGWRTRSSDDLLWLPHAMQRYLELTGDAGLLEETAPFLESAALREDETERFETPRASQDEATLYEHGARAIDRALAFGVHHLPLIGGGDFQEELDRAGPQGRGESVWLGWLLLVVLRDWCVLAHERGDEAHESLWRSSQQALESALRKHGWDGGWFRRAYFDNGHPLGSHLNAECKIELATQAWAVLALPAGDMQAQDAMGCADTRLVDRRVGTICLLDPPLQHQVDHAGGVQQAPAGVFGNGAQQSQAGAWALMAQARLGRADLVAEYLALLSPAHRTRSPAGQRRYRAEPYAVAGEVYSQPPYEGRAGWSWHTPAAGWLYRAALESVLGLQVRGDRLCVWPCLPPQWAGAELTLQWRGRRLQVRLGAGDGPAGAVEVDAGEWIALDSLPQDVVLTVRLAAGSAPAEPASAAGAAAAAGA